MTRVDPDRAPFVGPLPYTADDHVLFFGRDAEVAKIVSLVIAQRSVLLYAVSGAGKSSLLRAGMGITLADQGFEVLGPLRFQSPVPPPTDAGNVYSYAAVRALADLVNDNADPLDPSCELSSVLASLPRGKDPYGFATPRVVIFDQFEELFTTYQDRWQHREAFMQQVAEALEHDAELRVVFSIREEYIAQVDRYARLLPGGLRARFHLERLRVPSALAAVTGPLALRGVYFDSGVADALVHDLAETRIDMGLGPPLYVEGEFVEPVQLQVVCRTLWSRLPPSVQRVTAEDLATLGNVDESLVAYYNDAIAAAAAKTSVVERKLRDELERLLITSVGTRATVFAGERETATLPTAVLNELAERHLIRAEWRAGGRWLELAHDRLIEPIQRANKTVRERFRRKRRRRLALGGALLSVAVVLGVALGASVWFSNDTGRGTTMPSVVAARSVFEAAKRITPAGLKISHSTIVVGRAVPGTVISQSPEPGKRAAIDSVVSLLVATGSHESRVPDLKEVYLRRAQRALRQAGLTLGVVLPEVIRLGKVVSQTPRAGLVVKSGTPVDIVLAVDDRIAPILSVPADLLVVGSSAGGTRVVYSASARDNRDGSLTTNCDPSSGSLFRLGITRVTCSAQDSAGNSTTKSFVVVVGSPR